MANFFKDNLEKVSNGSLCALLHGGDSRLSCGANHRAKYEILALGSAWSVLFARIC